MPISFTWPAAPFPGPADDGYSFEEAPRVKLAKFGDGYEQRSLDGTNARPRMFSLTWPNLTTLQKDTLINFLRARNGVEGFYWTPPKEAVAIKAKAPRWRVTTASGPVWSVDVDIVQIFDA